jgi:hypothetical protein
MGFALWQNGIKLAVEGASGERLEAWAGDLQELRRNADGRSSGWSSFEWAGGGEASLVKADDE